MDIMESALNKHKEWKGKIEIVSRTSVNNRDELSHAYTPGVARPCLEIEKNPELSYELTRRHNLVAVITDGTAGRYRTRSFNAGDGRKMCTV